MKGTNGWDGAEILISQPGKNDISFGPNFISGSEVNLPVLIEGQEVLVRGVEPGNSPTNMGFTITDPDGNIICSKEVGPSFMAG